MESSPRWAADARRRGPCREFGAELAAAVAVAWLGLTGAFAA
jgi:hypothetical protein